MEGLFFEVKPRDKALSPRTSKDPLPSSHGSYQIPPSLPDYPLRGGGGAMTEAEKEDQEEEEEEVQYKLTLVGSLPVHPLTTMSMLPWVVAEIVRRPAGGGRAEAPASGHTHLRGRNLDHVPSTTEGHNQSVCLCVSASRVQCVCVMVEAGLMEAWDPLTHTVLFECRPHHLTKLLHNSQQPSSFGCMLKDTNTCTCYVFQSCDCTKVPEIISTLRQAGKSSARNDDITDASNRPSDASKGSTSETCTSLSLVTTGTNAVATATTFAKRFEVLFCGRVSVAHKKAPPALIDECIEKFGQSRASGAGPKGGGGLVWGLRRALAFQNGTVGGNTGLGNEGTDSPPCGRRPVLFKRDPSFPCLQALDENGLSPEIHSSSSSSDSHTQAVGVQPTSLQENRTMLFMVGRCQIFLVSPDTKKVSIEKSFREISFCSQGIRHVDHFGFICRETVEGGSCHFVCYVFQCTDEALVDEIMLTLKQAFSVASLQQTVRTQSLQCEACPIHVLHRLCERIEGLHPSKAKLELQRHLAVLENQEQASVFENTMRARPKSDQEENELVVSSLRALYEEKQKTHQHRQSGSSNKVCEEPALAVESQQSNSRQRLEQFKSRAKRSLTESLEGIWKQGSSRSKSVRENSEEDSCSSSSTITSSSHEDPLPPSSPLRSHNSTGDLKLLDTALSISSSSLSPLCDSHGQGFRRRANTFSHPPSPSSTDCSPARTHSHPSQDTPSAATKPKLVRHYSVSTDTPHQSKHISEPPLPPALHLSSPHSPLLLSHCPSSPSSGGRLNTRSPLGGLRARLRSSSSVPNFLKLLAPVHENDPSNMRTSDVAALSVPGVCVEGGSPLRTHRHSWRQQIFLRVATPQKNPDTSDRGDCCLEAGRGTLGGGGGGGGDGVLGVVPEEQKRRGRAELRELWRKAILQQILLLRMERENQKLQATESDLQNKRLKLDYEEITPCLKEVTLVWESMLGKPARSKVKFPTETIYSAVTQGVPRQHRGEVWKFLSEQYLLRQAVPSRPPANHTPYKELLKQLTSQQHAILIDLGRTFPTHPYFQAQLGAGQLSLYNLLKAYSLLDPEVGYCQGLSFVAGVLLLHMGEEDAFYMLKFLMYDMGLRKQYRPDMIILQIQMYQLSRLLHDYHRDLYLHLEQQEIGPSLYAAPWFLTTFASHFPLGFVARVFDMLFLQGSEVIFKVALSLLGSHKPLILQHDSLETIVDFIKTTLPNLGLVQMEKTINQVCEMDLSKQLQAYEVEYHVLQDELMDPPPTLNQSQRAAQLERTNQSLRQQNLDLLEELQVSQARVGGLEARVQMLSQSEGLLRAQLGVLEEDKSRLQDTVTQLHALLTRLGVHTHAADAHTGLDVAADRLRADRGLPDGDGGALGPLGAALSHPLALPERL
ncbi:TBC1 domain family member 1 isoform X3 [Hypomesus transpacificus]|nr:TBC1 domain family member 1 isoform X3 [Hypomesus transpacificus]XP_046901679.1 TBC1 domain family member 1 isoform X3 [Hypomesus transpacificus]